MHMLRAAIYIRNFGDASTPEYGHAEADGGEGGNRRDRPGVAGLCDSVSQNRGDLVVWPTLDRLIRDGRNNPWIAERLMRHGVMLVMMTDGTSDLGKRTAGMYA